jgi:YfiH family protein
MDAHLETRRPAPPLDLLIPDWPAPAWIGACMSTRAGGVSVAPWDSLNLGDHVGDDSTHVSENRRRFEACLPALPQYLRQVHGIAVADLDRAPTQPQPTQADAAVAGRPDTACLVGVADCLPVLFTDRRGSVVAAAHAGWRGLSAGVLEATLSALCQKAQCSSRDVLAWLGPCIGPEAFEVGAEVRAAFDRPGEQQLCRPSPAAAEGSARWLADLAGLARLRLQQVGVAAGHLYGNDSSAGWCTVSQADRFFSHRRATRQGLSVTGRMAAAIWIKPAPAPAHP